MSETFTMQSLALQYIKISRLNCEFQGLNEDIECLYNLF